MRIKYLQNVYLLIIYLNVFNPFLSNMTKNILELPNVLSILKDILLVFLFLYIIIFKKGLNATQNIWFSLFFLLFFSSLYLYTSHSQGAVKEGLYYFRSHSLPIIFFISSIFIFKNATLDLKKKFLNHLMIMNVISIVISITFYFISIFNINFFLRYMGLKNVVASLMINYANFIRATAPQAGPNLLGFYTAVNLFLLSMILLFNRTFKNKLILILITIANIFMLAVTFSRSSLLLVMISYLSLFLLNPNKFFKVSFKVSVISIVFLVTAITLTNMLTENRIQNWIESNISFKEKSMTSRSKYFEIAIEDFKEYYLYGYPRGTVGPIADNFGKKERHNVESSTFTILYDMGIFQLFLLFLSTSLVIVFTMRNIYQAALLLGIIVNLQFLPNLQTYGIMIYAVWIYFLLGDMRLFKGTPTFQQVKSCIAWR